MQQTTALSQSKWRYFPWAVAAGMGVVIAVNITMAVLATQSFPGNVGSDGFTLSNRYNQVMQSARQDQGRGWAVMASVADSRARIVARDRDGAPLDRPLVQVTARRPLGNDPAVMLVMTELAPGVLVSSTDLPGPGQWDLTIVTIANGASLTTTQRVIRK